jgi:hypothetical protein
MQRYLSLVNILAVGRNATDGRKFKTICENSSITSLLSDKHSFTPLRKQQPPVMRISDYDTKTLHYWASDVALELK